MKLIATKESLYGLYPDVPAVSTKSSALLNLPIFLGSVYTKGYTWFSASAFNLIFLAELASPALPLLSTSIIGAHLNSPFS